MVLYKDIILQCWAQGLITACITLVILEHKHQGNAALWASLCRLIRVLPSLAWQSHLLQGRFWRAPCQQTGCPSSLSVQPSIFTHIPWAQVRKERQTSHAHWAGEMLKESHDPTTPTGAWEPVGQDAEGRALHCCRGNHRPWDRQHREFTDVLWALTRGQTTCKGPSGDLLHHSPSRGSQVTHLCSGMHFTRSPSIRVEAGPSRIYTWHSCTGSPLFKSLF